MSTLKEAVESGRPWRLKGSEIWLQGIDKTWVKLDVDTAIRDDFEIKPGPEKPREWELELHIFDDGTLAPSVCDCKYCTTRKVQVRVHDADACAPMSADTRESVRWVADDMRYKAPELLQERVGVWISKLDEILNGADQP